MNIYNIPHYCNFLKSLSNFILEKVNSENLLSNITILLPSRRSCNELKRILLSSSLNEAIILPNIKAIGDIDYDDINLKDLTLKDLEKFSDFASNTSRLKYKILLISQLIKWAKLNDKALFYNMTLEQSANLALEFEKFLNEVNKNKLNLNNLETIVSDEYSKHWQEILNFLEIFGKNWNNFTKENNILLDVELKTYIIDFYTEYFKSNKPNNIVIIAGISGNIKSTCELIKSLVAHDNCFFIFSGLNMSASEDEWKEINIFHPQFFLKELLDKYIKIDRKYIKNIIYKENILTSENFEKLINYFSVPYERTHIWHEDLNIKKEDFSHISKIECPSSFEEIEIISHLVSYHYKKFNKNIAILVSDENFANRLENTLKNYSIETNNAFGNKFSKTEFMKYLFLILDVIKSNFEPIAFLSLLKHSYTTLNYDFNELQSLILLLEDCILRSNGNISLQEMIFKAKTINSSSLLNFLLKIFNIFEKTKLNKKENLSFFVKIHLDLLKELTQNGNENSLNTLYQNEEYGNDIEEFLSELIIESENYGLVNDWNDYLYLFNYLISENSYSDKYSIHPKITIISPQESKLINYDLVILANLNDGSFPIHISNDPWMSKTMRNKFGLPNKNQIIGSSYYDFITSLNNSQVILTRTTKEDGIPTIPSKYLMRLEIFLQSQNQLNIYSNNIWKNVFEYFQHVDELINITRPEPKPPLGKRPTELYATEIEKLINNPYDIYAKKILKLKRKEDFYEDKSFAFFGSATHKALELYIKNYDNMDKSELLNNLLEYGKSSFNEYFSNSITKELFFIRFINIANWFITEDEKIRKDGYLIYAEDTKKLYLPEIDFTISAKFDRIEKNATKSTHIIDYKTGSMPSITDVMSGKNPQLIIEAIILKDCNPTKLAYWHIQGKEEEKINEIHENIEELINVGKQSLQGLLSYFKEYEHSYVATCYDLNNRNYSSDYKLLSRVEEWGYL